MEILLGALADAIFSLVLADIGQRPGLATLREKLRGDSPEKLALQHALAKSYRAFAQAYPQIAHALFDDYFLRQPAVAGELAKLLTPDGVPSGTGLTQLWREQFPTQPVQEIAIELDFFLHSLASEIKSQPVLKPFTDSRAFEQLYQIAAGSERQVREQRTTNEHLVEMRRLLAEVAAGLTEKLAPLQTPTVPQAEVIKPMPTNFPNPFSDRGRINDPSRFFGRQQIVRELQQALAAGNSIALIGGAEVGKSSLLKYLYLTREAWLVSHEVIYLDLQGVIGEIDFCDEILQVLTLLPSGKLQTAQKALSALKRALRGCTVLLMLDEVEQLAKREFTGRLQGLLRALVQEGNLALLVASKVPLHQVFPPSDPTSPLHNVFRSTELSHFTQDEVQNFVRQRLTAAPIQFVEADLNALWQQSHGHPGQLQRAAELLFARKLAGS